jgi:hypothetical protein
MKDKSKDFALDTILIIIILFIFFLLISIFLIKNISLSRKISNSTYQHETIYRFIVAYNFICKTHSTNLLTFKTCTNNSNECKNGKIITPGITKISCIGNSANANNVAKYFVMHFNEIGYINHYNKGKNKLSNDNSSTCCSLKNSLPARGKTNIYGDNKKNVITITTNIGNKFLKDIYLTNIIDWPGTGFK